MSYEALNSAIFLGFYTAITIWVGLAILIVVQILKRNFQGLKISFLYLINSITFWIAWINYFKLAVIVRGGRVLETLEKSISVLRVEASNYLTKFLLLSLVFVILLAIINILYLKYFAKTRVRPRVLSLLAIEGLILAFASYISTELYFLGISVEISRYFN